MSAIDPALSGLSSRTGKAWIITNHAPTQILASYNTIAPGDLVVAVDRGLHRLHQLGITPQIVVGDMDSVDQDCLDAYPGLSRLAFASEKNETDTELALLWTISAGARQIVICNDMAGRIDHALGLVQNLELCSREEIDIKIDTGSQLLFMLRRHSLLPYPVGSLLSLFSRTETAEFAGSSGLRYALDNLVLKVDQSRGISNFLTASPAEIRLLEGRVLAVLSIFD